MGLEYSQEKIDVHNVKSKYKGAVRQLEKDTRICAENREYILQFLKDCQLGKTLKKRQKKKSLLKK